MVRVWQRRQEIAGFRALMIPVLLVAVAGGCKSSSWSARPTWLGGSPTASALTSAPSFDKGIAKPSETAKPYPTTGTPEGYALSETTRADAARSTSTPPAVTYGSTPAVASTAVAASPQTTPGVSTQVGPYAPIQQSPSVQPMAHSDPAAAATAGLAAAPGFGGAATPPGSMTPPAGERFADARGGAWGSPPAAAPAATALPATPSADSRYGTATTSRFGGGAIPPSANPQPQWSPAPAAPLSPPPMALPVAPVTPPPPPADGSLPGAIPPPTRRPDPGYRPGGTSSYRPTRALLAGDDEVSPVRPASFNAVPAEPVSPLP